MIKESVKMPQCAKCRDFFPPEFCVEAEEDDRLCLFCKRDIKEIRYGDNLEKVAAKKEIVADYILFTKMMKDELDNPERYEELMKKFALGDVEEESRIIKPF